MIAVAHDALAAQRSATVTALRLVRDTNRESAVQLRRALETWESNTSPHRLMLLIEDDRDLAGITASTLETELGVEVYVASTYEEGYRLSAALPWECVLVDLGLSDPTGTGVDILRRVPRDRPVVIVTGRLEESDLRRLATRSRCGWHVKGDSSRNLVDVVRAAIRDHGGEL